MEGFNGFPFPNNYSSSFSSGSSSVNNPKHEEAVMKKIVEAVELLEKQAKIGKLPQDSVQEIKQELKKKYPNISFSSENDAQKPQNTDHSQNNSTLPNSFPNDPFFAANHFINQINQQQQLNNAIFQQAQLASNQAVEQYMRMIGVPRTYTNPVYSAPSYPYFDATTFPSYHNNTTPSTNYGQMSGDAMKMAFEMMGNMNNQEAISPDAFSSLAGFGGDDSSASATALSSTTSIPSFVSGSSSTPTPSFGPSFSTANFGFSSSSPSFPSVSSTTTNQNQNNDEATMNIRIVEAVELLEKKSESGVFPHRKLEEIKHELEKKYPNIFSTKTYSQKNQGESYDDHRLTQEQEMDRYIQRQMNQIRKMERHLKLFGETEPELSRNCGSNYHSDFEDNHGDQTSNLFGNSRLGSDGCSALSFLGSLLGGSGL